MSKVKFVDVWLELDFVTRFICYSALTIAEAYRRERIFHDSLLYGWEP